MGAFGSAQEFQAWSVERAREMLDAVAAQDVKRVGDILGSVEEQPNGIAGVCGGIAHFGVVALRRQMAARGLELTGALPRLRDGEEREDPGTVFAVRFMAGWASDDNPLCSSLFEALGGAPDEVQMDAVVKLLILVSGIEGAP